MPQSAFLKKSLAALKEWLPYQAAWLIETQPDTAQSIIRFSHGQSGQLLPVPADDLSLGLREAHLKAPLPMVITQSTLMSHQHHRLHSAMDKLLNSQPYLIFTDCSSQPDRALILTRLDHDLPFSDRDRIMAEWLLPHLCEASKLSPAAMPADPETPRPRPRSPLELHLDSQGRSVFCGEYIQACIDYCSTSNSSGSSNCCTQSSSGQLTVTPELFALIQKQRPEGQLQLGRMTFDIQQQNQLLILRVHPESIRNLLTSREREIATELAKGQSYKAVAKELNLSPSTVTNYANRIYRKLNVHSKSQLAHLYTLTESVREATLH